MCNLKGNVESKNGAFAFIIRWILEGVHSSSARRTRRKSIQDLKSEGALSGAYAVGRFVIFDTNQKGRGRYLVLVPLLGTILIGCFNTCTQQLSCLHFFIHRSVYFYRSFNSIV